MQFCIMPSDKRSPSFVFYVSKTRISDLVSCKRLAPFHSHRRLVMSVSFSEVILDIFVIATNVLVTHPDPGIMGPRYNVTQV